MKDTLFFIVTFLLAAISCQDASNKSASQESREQTHNNYRSSRDSILDSLDGLTYQMFYLSNGYLVSQGHPMFPGDTTAISSNQSSLYFFEDNSLLWILDEAAGHEGSPWYYWPSITRGYRMDYMPTDTADFPPARKFDDIPSTDTTVYCLMDNLDIGDEMTMSNFVFYGMDAARFNFGPLKNHDKSLYWNSWIYNNVIKGEKGVF